ncbi:MAG: hypothetical protein RLZZ360_326 [Candidatus Parcubacteria bacterium]|jgi:hypothetical protein
MSRLLHSKIIAGLLICGLIMLVTPQTNAGTLSCSITTNAACTQTKILRLSDTTNAHAELPSQSTAAYDNNVVCCTNVIGLGNSCAGTNAIAVKLSATTNAHAEQNTEANYAGNNACISVPTGGSVTVGYQASNCTGYDTTIGSIESLTNSHVGDAAAYTTKICATASGVPQTLVFSISDNSIGFGSLSPVQTRYATGDTVGATSDSADAHTISIASNATGGYSMTISGQTLTSGAHTITAIGGTAVAPAVGNEQFGVRLSVNSGTGSAASPYNGSNWALDTGAFPDTIVTGSGDSVTTVYGARYMVNTATLTEPGNYNAVITYTVTATF